MSRRTSLSALVAILSLAVLAAAGSAQWFAPATPSVAPPAPVVNVSPASAVVACPPGVLNSFKADSQVPAPASVWSSTGLGPKDRAPESITAKAEGARTLTVPTGIIVAGQGGGELIGLSATGCAAASSDQWIAAGATTLGEDLIVVLANPAGTPSVVSITGHSKVGRVVENSQHVTVPARSSVTVVPGGWFPDEERLALHIEADGPGVAAWAQTSGMTGEVPAGAAWASALRQSTSIVIPAVTDATHSVLRIGAPADHSADVSIVVHTETGAADLPGGVLEIGAGTVLDVPLDGIGDTPVGLSIASDVPIVAQVMSSYEGAAWSDGATWTTRSVVSPAPGIVRADLPGARDLTALVATQLNATPLRATSVPAPSGGDEVSARLVLVGPIAGATVSLETPESGQAAQSGRSSAAAPATTVMVGEKRIEVAAGSSMIVDVPESGVQLTSSAPIRAAILLEAQTPVGPVRAVWPVGTLGVGAQQGRVLVTN